MFFYFAPPEKKASDRALRRYIVDVSSKCLINIAVAVIVNKS